MDHIAILRKSNIKKGDDLLGDILDGTKTIESRWYINRIAPWNKIKSGESVYFKESGQPITAKAKVSKVLQFENLNNESMKEIIDKYGNKIAPNTSKETFYEWITTHENKRYCILVFLSDVEKITPFNINKSGFGNSCAWMVLEDIEGIRKHLK